MEYRQVGVRKFPQPVKNVTPEAQYWKRFKSDLFSLCRNRSLPKSPVLVKEYGSVTSIEFSPIRPYDFAVTASLRVQVYSSRTSSLKRSVSRFTNTARSASFRSDGKLMVAGDDSGLVQIFNANSRAILRTLRGHTDPVHFTRFMPDKTHVLSCSNDKTVRVWDMPRQEAVCVFSGHTDYVRTGAVCAETPHIAISGSYDHTVKLWDVRAGECVATIEHGEPVENVLAYPGGSLVAVAGGPCVKVYDLLAGGRQLATLGNHEKTVTSLCFDGAGSRLLTGSLDHHVKIYDVQDYRMVHSIKYPAPVLSVGVAPDDTVLAVGMASGLLSIRKRVQTAEETQERERELQRIFGGTYEYFLRNRAYAGGDDDFRIESRRRKRLADYDKYLKSFQYTNALDAVLSNNRTGLTVVSLLQELMHRDGLRQALAGRDELSLDPVVRFLIKYIAYPRYSSLLIDVANTLLDIYGPVLGQSAAMSELLGRLRHRIKVELRLQGELQKLMGSMDMLIAASESGALRAATSNGPLSNDMEGEA
ncbi:snoRNA-binding rRNA-processing protein [Spiromyces aspiralis]|uniref:SnoRNA-binding rRNA-processing protein n=1 Tax=Spiromyces aspiralis TaxID=68401 RepID=A0ACC1HZG9_9FUNG|nr:snoRNA-binding rRNA-processing protein [Spiromyces aspiralis]